MTDLADGKMIAEKNPNDLGGKILAKPYTLKREDVAVRYQQLLANIKTSDPVLTEFFIDQQKEENLNVVLDLMPYREEFQLLFNNYTETDFKFVDHSSKGKDREFAVDAVQQGEGFLWSGNRVAQASEHFPHAASTVGFSR
jgi:hypothetical protein